MAAVSSSGLGGVTGGGVRDLTAAEDAVVSFVDVFGFSSVANVR